MTDSQQKFSGQALIVTVSENHSTSISSLGAAVETDGNALTQALQDTEVCGYSDGRVKRLSGKQTTLANIKAAFQDVAANLKPDDPFLFFYSGHGSMADDGGILIPYDADIDTASGILSSMHLATMIRKIPSRRKLIIVDACYSGGLALAAPKSAKPMSNAILGKLESGEGVVVIASSRSTETSVIQPGDILSLFTKHIVSALKGAAGHDSDGFVRVFDLFNYVAEQVRKEEPKQAPVYAAYHQDSNFPVAYCAATEKRKKKADTTNSGSSAILLDTFCVLYPLGPTDQDIWYRAGGDVSRLRLGDSGKISWSRAIQDMERGSQTTIEDLVQAAFEDYPFNRKLQTLKMSFS